MRSKRLPPVAAVIGFIDCINRGDIDGLGELMTDDHELVAEPHDGCVAVLGHTTGSHLGLPDHEERALSLIWLAEVKDGQLLLRRAGLGRVGRW
jgi:hypothetical protein